MVALRACGRAYRTCNREVAGSISGRTLLLSYLHPCASVNKQYSLVPMQQLGRKQQVIGEMRYPYPRVRVGSGIPAGTGRPTHLYFKSHDCSIEAVTSLIFIEHPGWPVTPRSLQPIRRGLGYSLNQ